MMLSQFPGYGDSWGEGWHDGTATGESLFRTATQALFNEADAAKQLASRTLASPSVGRSPNAAGPGWAFSNTGVPTVGGRSEAYYNPLTKPGSFSLTSGQAGAAANFCDLITDTKLKMLCKLGATFIPGGDPGLAGSSPPPPAGCPAGYHSDGAGGCVIDGVGGYIPGDVGQQDTGWTPVNGRYGAGRTPIRVVRQVRACPPGEVLGKDGVCYEHLPRTQRMHNPGAKPLFTGGDMNALRRAAQLKKTFRRAGKYFPKPAQRCGPKKKR